MAKTVISSVPVAASSSGATALKAAATGAVHELLAFSFSAAGTVAVKFQSASTDLTGAWNLIAGMPVTITELPGNVMSGMTPICSTVAGEALNINLGGNIAVGGVAIVRTLTP